MAKFIIVLLCGLIPSLLADCSVEKAKQRFGKPVYQYTVNLLPGAARASDNHFVISPLSSWNLLACLSVGASDVTLAELLKVLKLLQRNKCLNKKYLEVANMVRSNNESDVILEGGSYMYASKEIQILEQFKTRLLEIGSSEIQSLSFEDSDSTVKLVNDHIRGATHGTIRDIVTQKDFDDVLMIVIDAIYFKGSWEIPFSQNETKKSSFYNEEGKYVGDVNLMHLSDSFNFIFMDKIEAKVLELQYGNNKKYSMLIFLPYDEVPLSAVIDGLKNITLKSIYKNFEKHDTVEVNVQLPRFKIDSDLNLKELLTGMGLHSMFDSRAQFKSISDHPLYVSKFIQKATIEVTEEGSAASAVSKAELGFRTFPEEFVANKPFLFMIVDRQVKVPIFNGAYSKPSLY